MKTNTIAAIATALSNGGISIIRISGEEAFSIIDKLYESKTGKKKLSQMLSHTIHYGYIKDLDKTVDEVMVLIMRAPHTYTKEDVVEIDCHGGVTVTKSILELVIKNGARAAEPGEFTKRAFLNGRIDLSQAEAVMDLIKAKNQYALQSSVEQLKGKVFIKVRELRESILCDIAYIEASLDDPEHIKMGAFSQDLRKNIDLNKRELTKLINTADNGRLLTEGIKTVIAGSPNVGKSSLLNFLLGEERAIVTEIAGTTRDILEENINLDGILLKIVDTAGIRKTEDPVERIGVERAKKYARAADLILYVMDASLPFDENDRMLIAFMKEKNSIFLLNKSDLNVVHDIQALEAETGKKVISISIKEGTGLEILEQTIKDKFFHGDIAYNDEVAITNVRHRAALEEALESLDRVEESIENQMPEDFYSIDLMNAYQELGKIIGESVEEDLVNKIFSEFCMGK